ncbi:hypothetical protein SAMN05421874_12843 [Nonomuraea maritima]|uniref:Uncharacterized protein n=1 Tax=Nonomuraea maritima TaxID=683260 RepID=A0A1G9MHX2_9ACTN|nr:hypothetical protein [Nonomuraea maritima]SDL73744.1 hypothetical protein SAMN05421874_12843 [Nonomuraea maritima]
MTADANSLYAIRHRQPSLEEACLILEFIAKEIDNGIEPLAEHGAYDCRAVTTWMNELAASLEEANIPSYAGNEVFELFHRLERELDVLHAAVRNSRPNYEIASVEDRVRLLAYELHRVLDRHRFRPAVVPYENVQPVSDKPRVEVARPATRMVKLALFMLPHAHRERYDEEAHSELYDLARAKATASMQVYHALRYGIRMVQLRSALKDPARRSWEPVLQVTCWILATEFRTWLIIGSVTTAALINVVAEQGWGSAVLAAPTAWMFHHGARWLRKRLGLSLKEGDEE